MFYEKDATGRVFAHVVCSAAKRVRLSIIAQSVTGGAAQHLEE
jgi:hypothetical protein